MKSRAKGGREPRDLTRFVGAEVDDARVERVLAKVNAEPRRPWAWIAGGTVALAAAAAGAWLALSPPATTPQATLTPPPVASDHSIVLPDGARVAAREGDVRVDVASRDAVALTVERGSADFVVPHVESRRFVVHVGPYDVIDVGTTFRVELVGSVVHVAVREGAVEVRRDGVLLRVVSASEAWDGTTDAEAGHPADPIPVASSDVPPVAATSALPKPPVPAGPGPKELMAQADEARIAGKPRDAAAALDTLRRQYRSDPRAGIAAFELGRLRLDALGDPKGAIEALDDALLLAPRASFREDAEARRVEALDRAHDARCSTARDLYAQHYPNGVHAVDVANRCR